MTTPVEKSILRLVMHHRSLSRARLQVLSGVRKMTVYASVDDLVRRGLLTEGTERRLPRGRPERPVEIPTGGKRIAGILIRPDRIETGHVNLIGEPVGPAPVIRRTASHASVVTTLGQLMQNLVDDDTLAVGIATTGFLDSATSTLLVGSERSQTGRAIPLAAVLQNARVPVVLQNDLHALAARWVLTERNCTEPAEDLLMVFLDDGQVGAAMLIEGRPNRGCVGGANELGHTRLAVATEPCYCGSASGCVERVFSSRFLSKIARGGRADLLRSLAEVGRETKAIARVIDLTGTGIANAVNLTRAGRLVLAGPGVESAVAFDRLAAAVRKQTLGPINERLQIDRWATTDAQSARSAACLAIAHLVLDGWSPVP